MTAWTSEELATIDAADEIEVLLQRSDGSSRRPVTIWVVRHGDDIYVRSVNGPGAAWFRAALGREDGRISATGFEMPVRFVAGGPGLDNALDAAFRTKYRRSPASSLDHITSAEATVATFKLEPLRLAS